MIRKELCKNDMSKTLATPKAKQLSISINNVLFYCNKIM